MHILVYLLSLLLFNTATAALLDNLQQAQKGDYIVTAQGKNLTLLHIYDRQDKRLTIEEITAPSKPVQASFCSWKLWVQQRAPYNTSWVIYVVDLNTGKMLSYFSLTRNAWMDIHQADNFLTTLLNLNLQPILPKNRKKIGNSRKLWQPRMVTEGQEIPGVEFDAWRTTWPKDQTELSGKTVDVYLPQQSAKYPSYFPYWLEISGFVGNAKIRIIDSGKGMQSPAQVPSAPK
jgi:hypothetical protein